MIRLRSILISLWHQCVWLLLLCVLLPMACTDKPDEAPTTAKRTLVVWMPWTGAAMNEGLYRFFLKNIEDMKYGMVQSGSNSSANVVVCIAHSPTYAEMYRLVLRQGRVEEVRLGTFDARQMTDSAGIATLLGKVKSVVSAEKYAMIIGGHGVGWTYKDEWKNYPYGSPKWRSASVPRPAAPFLTRYFGSTDDIAAYGVDIETLAAGVSGAGVLLDYVLFDDCYMANVETAYALRHVARCLVASTSEILVQGMPYDRMWTALTANEPDYVRMTGQFYDYYSAFEPPYGALSVIYCPATEELAGIMREINGKYKWDRGQMADLQYLCGFSPHLFYDMTDYVRHLCADEVLFTRFERQMAQVVLSERHTKWVPTALQYPYTIEILHYSGITISDPSIHPVALTGLRRTEWWKATHAD